MNHDDVLNADLPNTEERRAEMLEAVKGRAKGCFQTRDMPNAEKLYGRAITLCERRIVSEGNPDGLRHEKDLHLLYSNRAAVRLLLSKWESALADCESSLDIDAGFIKSHFRKAQALIGLKRFEECVTACDQGLQLHEQNKELLDLKSTAEKKKKEADEAKSKPAEHAPESAYRPARPAVDAEKAKEGGSAASTNGTSTSNKENKSGDNSLRGYKKTADGKTTSYFHTELDEAAKKLIGDCRPQQIQAPIETATKVNGSAWNQAGTFEEKNVTSWFADCLKSEVKGSLLVGKNADVKLKYSCSKTGGDASVTVARGKTKYVHDMSATLSWRFPSTSGDPEKEDGPTVKGSITFEADGDGDWDVTVDVDSDKGPRNPADRDIVQSYVKGSGRGLQPEVIRKLKKVEGQFREKR